MDTNIKQCFICEETFDSLIGVDNDVICDDCKEFLCSKISKKYKNELLKSYLSIKITSKIDEPYYFGSANFFINKSFFIPIIINKANKITIQFSNTEKERDKIIESII